MTSKLQSLKGEKPASDEKERLTVYLSKDIVKALKIRKIETGESVSAALERLARAELDK